MGLLRSLDTTQVCARYWSVLYEELHQNTTMKQKAAMTPIFLLLFLASTSKVPQLTQTIMACVYLFVAASIEQYGAFLTKTHAVKKEIQSILEDKEETANALATLLHNEGMPEAKPFSMQLMQLTDPFVTIALAFRDSIRPLTHHPFEEILHTLAWGIGAALFFAFGIFWQLPVVGMSVVFQGILIYNTYSTYALPLFVWHSLTLIIVSLLSHSL